MNNTLVPSTTPSFQSNFSNSYHGRNNNHHLLPLSQPQEQQPFVMNEGGSSSCANQPCVMDPNSRDETINTPNKSVLAMQNNHNQQQQLGLPTFDEHLRLLNQVQQIMMMNQQKQQMQKLVNGSSTALANPGGMMLGNYHHQLSDPLLMNNNTLGATTTHDSTNMNAILASQYSLLNQPLILQKQQLTTPTSFTNQHVIPSKPQLQQQQIITYHSVEGCIVDENKIFGNINVLNADETKQTKIVVMPTSVFQRFLQPVLEHIKQALFAPLQQLPLIPHAFQQQSTMSPQLSFIDPFQQVQPPSELNLKLVVNSEDLEPFMQQQEFQQHHDHASNNDILTSTGVSLNQDEALNQLLFEGSSTQHRFDVNEQSSLLTCNNEVIQAKPSSDQAAVNDDANDEGSIIFEDNENQDMASTCTLQAAELGHAVDECSKDNTQQGNNYKKTNNKKGIKKKRKYIKSGLFRKDPKSGQFLFSSRDRARLATLITPNESTTGSCSVNIADEATTHEENANSQNSQTESIALFGSGNSTDQHSNSSSPHVSSLSPEYHGMDEHDRLAFELYCRETVPIHKDAASNMILLREQWRLLPQEERERYKRSVVVLGTIDNSNACDGVAMTNVDGMEELSEKDGNNTVVGKYSRVKRPLNAYNIFCKIHFPEFQQRYPNYTINQISKHIGEKWKSLSNEERQPYIEQSKKNSQPVVKKPLSAYNIFCKSQFEIFKKKYPDLSIHLLSRKVADSWKSLSEDEKRVYYEGAQKQRQENLLQVHNMIPTCIKQQ
ncbi:hypothetical protein C9374_013600 [Naegleria lovaniensis]|uniref:HMG box domain-containing protein n=1 Tax=Naegleria lovaniensis TaxID=51637 RepID=A0AA88GZL5_NAELO|nr:uncharacterized protein C9374_013600 [Naegleria lovaniensis]KAG2392115.1 hypothetical protein C9374_013600 [Naegleria lovaniensis]